MINGTYPNCYLIFLTQYGLGYILGNFFTVLSGHPDPEQQGDQMSV
jgi:hypothetical protein